MLLKSSFFARWELIQAIWNENTKGPNQRHPPNNTCVGIQRACASFIPLVTTCSKCKPRVAQNAVHIKTSHQTSSISKKIDAMASMVKKSKSAVVDKISPEFFLLAIGAAPVEYSGVGWRKWSTAAVL